MRWVRLGSYGCMIHAAGDGGGWHVVALGNVCCIEKD
jgi:hypothetical protein